MKKRQILMYVFLLLFVVLGFSTNKEINFKNMYQTVITSIKPIEYKEYESENLKILENIIKQGLSSFNIIAPYVLPENKYMNKILKQANFSLTLRAAKSVELFQNFVHGIVLIVDPLSEEGVGAGFIIDSQNGICITNFHVTSGLRQLYIQFYKKNQNPLDGMMYLASVIRYNAKKDIAILKLKSPPSYLKSLKINTDNVLHVGDDVHTIGHPLSLTWTYSKGMITSIRNDFRFGEEEIADVIQIDANVSPGNSGGPLLDNNGNVIGMVTCGVSSEYAQNLNFAVSSRELSKVINSRKNIDTNISKLIGEMYGLSLLSYRDVLNECYAYPIDEDKNGVVDYYSLVNKNSMIEQYRYIEGIEMEVYPGETQRINVLAMDISEDGEMDVLLFDYDSDLLFDCIAVDMDSDGSPDLVGIDTEGSGIITQAWITKVN